MTSHQTKLAEAAYFRAMRMLQHKPDLAQRELADNPRVRVGGLNYCLKALMGKCMVKMNNFTNSKNKFGYVDLLARTRRVEKTALAQPFLC